MQAFVGTFNAFISADHDISVNIQALKNHQKSGTATFNTLFYTQQNKKRRIITFQGGEGRAKANSASLKVLLALGANFLLSTLRKAKRLHLQ